MYDLRIEVDEVRGFCDLPMKPGDYFEVKQGKIMIPEGKYICLWALQSIMPMLPLKERTLADDNDWVPHTDKICCPDPNGMVIYRIIPINKEHESFKERLLVDPERCTGCRLCEEACLAEHKDDVSSNTARIKVEAGGEDIFVQKVCRQCGTAPCVHACPYGALFRDPETKAVLLAQEQCRGCGDCVAACPFEGINFDAYRGKPVICDLCGGELACVQSCPQGVLMYGDRQQVSR